MVDDRLNANPRVDEAHHRVLPAEFKYLVTEMLAEAAGGPQRYSGRSMEESHRELLITPDEWRAFMDDLNRSLDKFNIPQPERSEVIAIVESTRNDIVVEQSPEPARAGPTARTRYRRAAAHAAFRRSIRRSRRHLSRAPCLASPERRR
jgi:hemoglobin